MKITYNTRNINKINEQAKLALLDTAEAIKTDLVQNQTVPKDKGELEGDMYVSDKKIIKGIAQIINPAIYARKVYFDPELHISQKENKNAKQYWFDDYITGSKKNLPQEYFQKLLKRRLN